MGAVRLVHFGGDASRRIEVLREAGFEVRSCETLSALLAALSAQPAPDAILLSEAHRDPSPDEVAAIRRLSVAPLVLFQGSHCRCQLADFDLVIPTLTAPAIWLERIGSLVSWTIRRRAHAPSSADPLNSHPGAS